MKSRVKIRGDAGCDANAPAVRTLRLGNGLFEPLRGELRLDGRVVTLRPRTAALLGYLLAHPDRVVEKDELMQAVWPDVVVTEDSIVQCIKEIRQALGEARRGWIRTLPRQGYAFIGNPPRMPGAFTPDEAATAAGAATASPGGGLQARWRQVVAGTALVGSMALGLVWLGWPAQPDDSAPPPLSIVVLPITNATGDADRDDTIDDLTEALTDSLGRAAGTLVIAPSTAFTFKGKPVDARRVGAELHVRYVLEGSLRLDDTQPVLTVRLAETASAVQLWSQEFRPTDSAPLRELVVDRVANTLGLQLMRAESRAARRDSAISAGAASLMTQARAALRAGNDASPAARTLLESVVQHDDDAEAWAMLATSYVWEARLSATRDRDLQQAQQAVERALAIAPDNVRVRVAEGRVYGESGHTARALAAYDRAIALNPNSPDAHAGRGDALIMLGRADEALLPIERAMRISPYDAKFFVWQMYAGVAHLHLAHYAAAVELFSKVVADYPQITIIRLFLAGALGASGRIPEARAEMQELMRMQPELTLARFRSLEPSNARAFFAQRRHLYDGLRAAGIPE